MTKAKELKTKWICPQCKKTNYIISSLDRLGIPTVKSGIACKCGINCYSKRYYELKKKVT
jgi:transcription elongation factor Elf1